MKKEDLKPADIVEFIAGGPIMAIIREGDIMEWRCGWFSSGEYKVAEFNSDTLKKTTKPTGYTGFA